MKMSDENILDRDFVGNEETINKLKDTVVETENKINYTSGSLDEEELYSQYLILFFAFQSLSANIRKLDSFYED